MRVVFLIGNGFDMNLGLKTGYTDFFNDYAKKHSESNKFVKAVRKLSSIKIRTGQILNYFLVSTQTIILITIVFLSHGTIFRGNWLIT